MLLRKSPIVALAISDLHLSLTPPLARVGEANWLKAQERALNQVKMLAEIHKCPVLIAGDIFDKWNVSPELINWAIDKLPTCFAIPGNHDLPSHRQELAHRSGYGTLVRAGKIVEVTDPIGVGYLKLYARPFNGKIPKRQKGDDLCLHVLLTHDYLWVPGCEYYGADKESRLGRRAKKFKRFDAVVVGDNHIGFQRTLANGTQVLNCGTLMRRKTSEKDYTPSVGLIHLNGSVTRYFLPIKKDVLTETTATEDEDEDIKEMEDFIEGLESLEMDSLDFRDNVMRCMKSRNVSKRVRDVILEALESKK